MRVWSDRTFLWFIFVQYQTKKEVQGSSKPQRIPVPVEKVEKWRLWTLSRSTHYLNIIYRHFLQQLTLNK